MRSLGVPDLARGADAGHLGLVPIDVVRPQLAQSATGVGRTFVNTKPQAGLAIFGNSQLRQVTDPTANSKLRGLTSRVPFRVGGE
jgi:hypothetical protein